jgi:hypothetical protein
MSRLGGVPLLVATISSLVLVTTVFLSVTVREENTELADKHATSFPGLQVSRLKRNDFALTNGNIFFIDQTRLKQVVEKAVAQFLLQSTAPAHQVTARKGPHFEGGSENDEFNSEMNDISSELGHELSSVIAPAAMVLDIRVVSL